VVRASFKTVCAALPGNRDSDDNFEAVILTAYCEALADNAGPADDDADV